MILFIYGEDTFRSHQKLIQIKAKFIDASLGDTNLSTIDCADKDIDYTHITRSVLAMPFLTKSRLVIIKNLLSSGKKKLQEQFLGFLDKIPETTVLVIYESEKVDRRMTLFKALSQTGSARFSAPGSRLKPASPKIIKEEFKLLEPYELKKWIKNEVESNGGTIDNMAIDKLIEYVGNDLWRLSNEIQKLISYCHSEPYLGEESRDPSQAQDDIKVKDVELLVRPRVVSNVFDLIDAIGAQNIKKAQSELHKLLDSGGNELYIHTMVVYQFRNLLIIKDLMINPKSEALNSKEIPNNKPQITNKFQISNSNDQNKSKIINLKSKIASQSGLHPFVVDKTMNQAKNYTFERLKEIYQILLDYDIKMKIGQIEPRLALDLLLVDLINK